MSLKMTDLKQKLAKTNFKKIKFNRLQTDSIKSV